VSVPLFLHTLLLFLFSFLPGQPKSYRSIVLVRLSYLRKWDVSLFISIYFPLQWLGVSLLIVSRTGLRFLFFTKITTAALESRYVKYDSN